MGRASQQVIYPDHTDKKHYFFTPTQGRDKTRSTTIELLKLKVNNIEDLDQLNVWNKSSIKRLILEVKIKDSKRLENFLAAKGYTARDSYFE
jgi:hypothetical protein